MPKVNYLIDMDGVLISGQKIIPGADEFIARLRAKKIKFLVLTNNPISRTACRTWDWILTKTRSSPAPWQPPVFCMPKCRAAKPL